MPFLGHCLIFAVLQALDVLTTRVALALGAKEGNPLMQGVVHRPALLWLLKGAAGVVILAGCYFVTMQARESGQALLWFLHGTMAATVYGNALVIRDKRRGED